MPLRTKILLMVSSGIALFTATMFVILSGLAKDQMDRTVREDMETANTILGKFIEEHGKRLQNTAGAIASFTVVKSMVQEKHPDKATLEDFFRDQCKKMGADAILVLNQEAQVLTRQRVTPGNSMPLPDGLVAKAAMNGESNFRLVVDGNELRITAGVPVMIGRVNWGAICFSEDVNSNVAKQIASEVGATVAFEVQGELVGFPSGAPSTIELMDGSPTEVKIGGVPYMALKSKLPADLATSDARIVTLKRKDEVLGPFIAFRTTLVFILGIAFAVAMLLAMGLARNISGPLESIVRAAETVCQGRWPEPFQSQRTDEIGVLQSAFDKMTESVRAAQDRLLSLLDTDVLTELANHRRFQERLSQEVARATSSGEELSLLLIDLDHFQEFNRKCGHSEGDRLLRYVADVIQQSLPEFAFAARYGGEEFGVVMPRTNLEDADHWAEEMRAALRMGALEAFQSEVTASVGCAKLSSDALLPSGLTLEAELALARAKQLGRDRVCHFDSSFSATGDEKQLELQSFLADGSYATIQALAAAVDAKDPYTQGHSMRVADYASCLAKAIGLKPDEIELIRITGTLHDVGKIGVPDAVLLKPETLNDEERRIIETHPVLGEVIVRKVPALLATLPGVRNHHERWDGKGYPDGLKGEVIPRIARILALADTFDAMTSDRPYRSGMTAEHALKEIAECAGSQFDPELAPVFIEVMGQRRLKKAA